MKETLDSQTERRIYGIWNNTIQRCSNPRYPNYETKYGGQGVRVYPGWKNDYQAFLKWAVDNGYKDNRILDRIDSKGDYSPFNCQWSTRLEQVHRRWREDNYRDPNAPDDRWRSKATGEVV